jgi:hypothetical protein
MNSAMPNANGTAMTSATSAAKMVPNSRRPTYGQKLSSGA